MAASAHVAGWKDIYVKSAIIEYEENTNSLLLFLKCIYTLTRYEYDC
jgi:hypothetical protein